ncbi:type II toxin-antitoxin system VapC family toxin [soil metagenome]
MKVLLDTHALLWATMAPRFLSSGASAIIEDESNTIFVSAASAWEIATKVRIGKLPGAEALELNFLETMDAAGYTLLSINTGSALRAGRFTSEHRDPFDRILAAQALSADMPVLSIDPKLDTFGIRRIW